MLRFFLIDFLMEQLGNQFLPLLFLELTEERNGFARAAKIGLIKLLANGDF